MATDATNPTTTAPATLGGVNFFINPESVSWNYTTKTSTTLTVGGKVVQVFGTYISNVIVTGSFGHFGITAQQAFLAQVEAWAAEQTGSVQNVLNGGQAIFNGPPLKFIFPVHNWTMTVYILNYNQPGSNMSVMLTNDIVNYQYELTLLVVQTNNPTSLIEATTASMIDAIQRLSATFGYFPTKYNGPVATGQFPQNTRAIGTGD
jgi:hypothetical protein